MTVFEKLDAIELADEKNKQHKNSTGFFGRLAFCWINSLFICR